MIRPFRLALGGLLAVLLLGSCEKEPRSGYHPPVLAERTVLLYMPGRDLEERGRYYSRNIEAVCAAVSASVPGDGRMLVCYQPVDHASAVLLELYYDTVKRRCRSRELKTYADFDAGSAACVAQLFADVGTAAPARRYGLIIGCHGKAWVPASGGTVPYSLRPDAADHSGVWTPAPGAKVTRSFGDAGHELDIEELAEALEGLDFRFDYLLFDDCFMSNIETLYDLRRAVDCVVASPCEIMGAGFPYDRIVPHLFAPGSSTRAALTAVCRAFWYFYEYDWDTVPRNERSGCITLAVLSELDALAERMRRVVDAGEQAFDVGQLQVYKGGTHPVFYDLGQYVALRCGDAAAAADFRAQLDRAFPPASRLHTAEFYSAYNRCLNPIDAAVYTGVTTSEPASVFTTEHRRTAWYRDTHPGEAR